jgi:hypothetical protein
MWLIIEVFLKSLALSLSSLADRTLMFWISVTVTYLEDRFGPEESESKLDDDMLDDSESKLSPSGFLSFSDFLGFLEDLFDFFFLVFILFCLLLLLSPLQPPFR